MGKNVLEIHPTLIVVAFNNKAPDVKSSSKFLGIQVLLAPHQGQGGGLNISRTGQSNYKSILKGKPSKTYDDQLSCRESKLCVDDFDSF